MVEKLLQRLYSNPSTQGFRIKLNEHTLNCLRHLTNSENSHVSHTLSGSAKWPSSGEYISIRNLLNERHRSLPGGLRAGATPQSVLSAAARSPG